MFDDYSTLAGILVGLDDLKNLGFARIPEFEDVDFQSNIVYRQ